MIPKRTYRHFKNRQLHSLDVRYTPPPSPPSFEKRLLRYRLLCPYPVFKGARAPSRSSLSGTPWRFESVNESERRTLCAVSIAGVEDTKTTSFCFPADASSIAVKVEMTFAARSFSYGYQCTYPGCQYHGWLKSKQDTNQSAVM